MLKRGEAMKEVYLYNERTRLIHIEGLCPDAKKVFGYPVFESVEAILQYDNRVAGFCEHCIHTKERETVR